MECVFLLIREIANHSKEYSIYIIIDICGVFTTEDRARK